VSREKFSERRDTITLNVKHRYRGAPPKIYCISFSMLPSGRVGELWVNSINGYEKLVNDDVRDACVAVSKDLQNGDTVEQLAKSVLRDSHGKPHGWLGSILDALKKEPVDA
jgi:hypothetical protein